jgi:hypothetical protein
MKVKLENVRITFPQLFQPKSIVGADGKPSEPKYGASFLFEPGSEPHKALSEAIKKVASEKWPTAWQDIVRIAKATDKLCVHDGNTKTYQGYPGNLFLSATTAAMPDIRDADRTRIPESNARRIYGGCYVNAVVQLWAQDNRWGKRVNAELLGVQFRRDGDAFRAGAVAADDDFDDLTAEAGEGQTNDDDESLI